jgi:hypothetical protein
MINDKEWFDVCNAPLKSSQSDHSIEECSLTEAAQSEHSIKTCSITEELYGRGEIEAILKVLSLTFSPLAYRQLLPYFIRQ